MAEEIIANPEPSTDSTSTNAAKKARHQQAGVPAKSKEESGTEKKRRQKAKFTNERRQDISQFINAEPFPEARRLLYKFQSEYKDPVGVVKDLDYTISM